MSTEGDTVQTLILYIVYPRLSDISKVSDLTLPVTLQPKMTHVDLMKAFVSTLKQSDIWVCTIE